ncbi:uncharacterized protein TNCV_4189181 [Trichonephila clavipes]|nr:uncharacterized protein TNCV_4189181 [Trichonephila clavipes]
MTFTPWVTLPGEYIPRVLRPLRPASPHQHDNNKLDLLWPNLGDQFFPLTNLGRVDKEMVPPGKRVPHIANTDRRKCFGNKGHNSLQDEEHTRRPRSAVIPDNVSAIRKMFTDDNRYTYQMIQKEINIGSAAMHKIIHEELRMKKEVCRWVPYNLTEEQKKRSVSQNQ